MVSADLVVRAVVSLIMHTRANTIRWTMVKIPDECCGLIKKRYTATIKNGYTLRVTGYYGTLLPILEILNNNNNHIYQFPYVNAIRDLFNTVHSCDNQEINEEDFLKKIVDGTIL